MNLYEMLIDEDNLFQGVNAISLVENPAIQSDWVALSKDSKKIQLAEVNAEKRILVGAALIPDKPIYRNQNGEEFYIYFSAETVRKAAELFFKNHNQDKATLEHETALEGLHIFESWIVEDTTHDKSRAYGLDVPAGSWVVTMKVNDDDIWNNYVKNNKVFGFSIEGQFANQLVKKMDTEMSETVDLDELDLQVALEDAKELLASAYDVELESYNDYPQAAVNNAKRALKYKKENGSSCGTSVGWTRASQIASKKKLSRSTIARMASFKRHQQNKDVPYTEGCGGIMWDAWGGSAGINWAIRKLKQIDKK
jgi:hypothetical protein